MGTNLECRKVYDLKLSEATNKKKNIDCYIYIYAPFERYATNIKIEN